jgi:biopolymer transport protein TolR
MCIFIRINQTCMKIFNEDNPISSINVTPFIDILLVLLVLFLFLKPSLNTTQLNVPTAGSSKAAAAASPNPLSATLFIQPTSWRLVRATQNPDTVAWKPLETLKNRIPQLLGSTNEVTIQGDKNLPYQTIMEAVGVLSKAGISNLSFLTQDNL